MRSSNAGDSTTAEVEVLSVSRHGFWIHVAGEEFFLPFAEYPWFENAPARAIFAVELLHGFHLRWPELDIDLELDCLRHPERYPLQFGPIEDAET